MNQLRTELLTKDIVYCLQNHCPLATSCLRNLVYEQSNAFHIHEFLDPRNKVFGKDCPHYLGNKVQRMARGFRRGIALIPHGNVGYFQSLVSEALGCRRSVYYEYANGSKHLTNEQEALLRKIFAEVGVSVPDLFDDFEEAYNLSV